MKIEDLVNEAMPYGFGDYLKNQIRGAIPFGAAGRAGAIGKTQVGLFTNKLYQEFHRWLGTFDGEPSAYNLMYYLKQKGLDIKSLSAEYPSQPKKQMLNDKQVGDAIKSVVQLKFAPPSDDDSEEPNTTPGSNGTPGSTSSSTNADTNRSYKRGTEIAKELDQVWQQARASQESQTSAPQVKRQIIAMAKDAGMTGMTIEGKFYSKFLNKTL